MLITLKISNINNKKNSGYKVINIKLPSDLLLAIIKNKFKKIRCGYSNIVLAS